MYKVWVLTLGSSIVMGDFPEWLSLHTLNDLSFINSLNLRVFDVTLKTKHDKRP
jgi:hypothetical protein